MSEITSKQLNTENVFVFPCVSRKLEDNSNRHLASKLMSEKNITNILKSITDTPSYVISWDDNTLKCVLDGYFFEIQGLEKTLSSGKTHKYLELRKADIGEEDEMFSRLDGTDTTDNLFNGLTVVETDTEPTKSDSRLVILTGNSTLSNIPESSYYKFSQRSVNVWFLDCGELK